MLQNPLTVVCSEYCVVCAVNIVLCFYHTFIILKNCVAFLVCLILENDCRILKFVTKMYRLKLPLFISEVETVLSFCVIVNKIIDCVIINKILKKKKL